MSKKQWLVLLMLFLTYLLLGASIFYHIESRLEIERVQSAKQERIEINALLREHYVPSHTHDYDEILEKLTQYCGKSVYNYTEGEEDPLKWDFYNSFYFAYTVVSTIGYGNLAPTNMLGRILMIFYGLVGIPMNGILLTQLGEFFGNVFIRAHRKYKSYKRGQNNEYCPKRIKSLERRKVGLAAQIFAYLTPGFIMFIFFPAFLFSHYEGWSYDEAVYYAFVTLTTIGFGDYVAGQDNSKGSGYLFVLYKTFLICWISFGLGYIVMIMTFIARGMRSKKITRIEHKLAINLKHTQSKIWNEFNKEIHYLRRVFNELQLSKVKRVYVDECEYDALPTKLTRSNSFPDLRDLTYGASVEGTTGFPREPRRRANSEVVPTEEQMARVVSETDLQRIDKTATFATHAIVQPAELLSRLVNILGYAPPILDDARDPMTSWEPELDRMQTEDEAIRRAATDEEAEEEPRDAARRGSRLFSTEHPSWTMGNERILPFARPRSRAASEVRLPAAGKIGQGGTTATTAMGAEENGGGRFNAEWTWSGPAASRKIRELMKARAAESIAVNGSTREGAGKSSKLRSFGLTRSVPRTLLPRLRKQFTNKKSSDVGILSFLTGRSQDKGGDEKRDPISANSYDRRDSVPRGGLYYTHTGAANASSLMEEGSSLLEETSLADFLRALTVLHATVGTVPEDCAIRKPRRKMGTASLTPPKLPSLFTLFSSPPSGEHGKADAVGASQSGQNTISRFSVVDRRFSLGFPGNKSSGLSSPSRTRRGSLAFAPKPRRFSLRPVPTPVSPPTPPPSNNVSGLSRNSSSERVARPTDSAFLLESPREPLVRTEREPGTSSPVRPAPPNPRRFSLRPPQAAVLPTPGGSSGAGGSATKPIPRWKAGMLQRQIGQMNLRRRVRAFSLSDVHADNFAGDLVDAEIASTRGGTPEFSRSFVRSPSTKSVTLSASAGESVKSTNVLREETSSANERSRDSTFPAGIVPRFAVAATNLAVPSGKLLSAGTSRHVVQQPEPPATIRRGVEEDDATAVAAYGSLVEVKVERPAGDSSGS